MPRLGLPAKRGTARTILAAMRHAVSRPRLARWALWTTRFGGAAALVGVILLLIRRWGTRSGQRGIGEGATTSDSIFEWALRFSGGLPDRTAPAFEGVRALYPLVMGMVYHVAQRLIDAKQRGRAPNAPDEALIVLCNRLFNESFAGYVVLSHGLVAAGQHHLRAAVETANLATLFLLKPEHAERWLNGTRYSPGKVRKLIDAPEELREWYSWLSRMTHTNYAASGVSVFELNEEGDQVLFYGGLYAPRAMASTTMAFVWIAVAFLRLFYLRYSERLEELSLLWSPELTSATRDGGMTWDDYLEFIERFANDVDDEIHALPEDEVVTPEWAATIDPARASDESPSP